MGRLVDFFLSSVHTGAGRFSILVGGGRIYY